MLVQGTRPLAVALWLKLRQAPQKVSFEVSFSLSYLSYFPAIQ